MLLAKLTPMQLFDLELWQIAIVYYASALGEEGREVRLPHSVSYACSYLAGGVKKGGIKAL